MKDYDFEDGGAYVDDDECSECGDRDYKSSRIPGVCVACLFPAPEPELGTGTWTYGVDAVESRSVGLVHQLS